MSTVGFSVDRERRVALLELLRGDAWPACSRRPRRRAMNTSAASTCASDGVAPSRAALVDVDARDARRRRQRGRAADQRDVGAGLGGCLRERVAHLARARIGDAAHRVDRLERRPGGQQHALAGEQLGLRATRPPRRRSPRAPACGLRRSRRRPGRRCPGPRIATPSAASCATLRWLAGLRPHLPVHRRRDEQRAVARERTAWTAGRRRGRARAWRGSRRRPARRRSRRRRARGRCGPCRCRRRWPTGRSAPAGRTAPAASSA